MKFVDLMREILLANGVPQAEIEQAIAAGVERHGNINGDEVSPDLEAHLRASAPSWLNSQDPHIQSAERRLRKLHARNTAQN